MKSLMLFLVSAALALGFCGTAGAQHGGHGPAPSPAKTGASRDSVAKGKEGVQSKTVEGVKITLQVMSMGEHMMHAPKGAGHGEAEHAKSHTLMVTLQDEFSREILSNAKVEYTVIGPSGQKETGRLNWSGDHYAAGFSPREKGSYQVKLKVESGGMEREADFTYQAA